MDPKRIVMLVVGASVMVLIFSAILVPIINDATTTEKEFVNDGYFKMSEITDDTNTTIVWNYTEPTKLNINGEAINVDIPIGLRVSIVGADSTIIRYFHPTADNWGIQMYSSAGYVQGSVSDSTNITVSINNMTISADNGNSTKSIGITQGYAIDPNGLWIMKDTNAPAYIHKNDSVMILAGITNIAGAGDTGVYAEGTINDGLEFTYVPTSSSTPTVTFGEVTFNYSDVSGYNDLVSLSSCVFDITNNGTTGTATYSYFIVPATVTAEITIHADDATRALLNAIPIIAMIGIVLAVVGLAFAGRNDYWLNSFTRRQRRDYSSPGPPLLGGCPTLSDKL